MDGTTQNTPTPTATHQSARRRDPVTLVKGGHRWTFTCETGEEPALLNRLAELAKRSDVPFDWFDAALVSHQLRRRLNAGLHRIDAPGPSPTTR